MELEGWEAVARNVWRRDRWEIVVDRRLRRERVTVELRWQAAPNYIVDVIVELRWQAAPNYIVDVIGVLYPREADEARAVHALARFADERP